MKIIRAEQPLCRSITKSLSITEAITVYEFEHGGFIYRLQIPKHYVFDGASIPRICWGIIGLTPHGVMDGAGLPHDFCYEKRGDFPSGCYQIQDINGDWFPCTVPMTKAMSDKLLKALCIHFKACGKIKATLVWSAVAAFGFAAWNSDDEKRKELILEHEETCSE